MCFEKSLINYEKLCKISTLIYINCISNKLFQSIKIEENLKHVYLYGNFHLKNTFLLRNLNIFRIEKNDKIKKWKNISIPNILNISFVNNKMENIDFIKNEKLEYLQYLNLSKNPLKSIDFLNKILMKNLFLIDFSSTKINKINEKNFKNLNKLKIIRMENIQLKIIIKNPSKYLLKVEYFYLKNTFYPSKYIKNLMEFSKNLKFVEGEKFQLCCLLFKILKNKEIFCKPKPSDFFTCDNIIPTKFMRILFWIFGIFGVFGNIFSVIILLITKKKSKLFRFSLSLGDFLTSIYVLSIAIVDLKYSGESYLLNEEIWRESLSCSILGTLLTFSLILSSMAILFIAIERYESVKNPFSIPKIMKYKYFFFAFILFLSILLSFIPFIFYKNVNKKFSKILFNFQKK